MKKVLLFIPLLIFIACDYQEDGIYPSRYNSDNINGDFPAPGEQYNEYVENPFIEVAENPVSTFSIDADGASYTNIRRFLTSGQFPPKAAVRTEEFINYFPYDYAEPAGGVPISVDGEVSTCPWFAEHKIISINLKGKTMSKATLPAANMVLLVDVSGSMSSEDKLPLLQQSLMLFVDEMRAQDKITIVTYAGSAGIALNATAGSEKQKIKNAINALSSGGSTAGAEGIITAYKIAEQNFVNGGNNRVILATDGDFNVGPSSQEELLKLIEEEREKGVFLTVLGFGQGNLNDGMMEQVADNGNGNYEYIDKLEQAKKVFVSEFGKFYTVAKDVKVQVEFNPATVEAYRLIGYENRLLEDEDFEDDKKDAGEIGAGQTITALYEIKPKSSPALRSESTFKIDFRYKYPDSDQSNPLVLEIFDQGKSFSSASENMRFASSVAAFAMLLIDSEYKHDLTYDHVTQWAQNASTYDPEDLRKEFLQMIKTAKQIAPN